MSCSLNLKNISFQELIKDVTLDLGHKEKIAIVGPNGCGKSTLLKIMVGLLEQDRGEVHYFHNHLSSKAAFLAYRHRIGYLFQDVEDQFICPSVIEEVAFNLLNMGKSKEEAYTCALEMLKEFNIDHLKEAVPMHLSGGEKKLVALASILISKPDILILDEPTNHLDAQTEAILKNILQKLDKSIVLVSHDEAFAKEVVHKWYRLEGGLTEV